MKTANPKGIANIAKSGSRKASRPKRKKIGNLFEKDANDGLAPKKAKAAKCPRGKRSGKKDKIKVTCYNCEDRKSVV